VAQTAFLFLRYGLLAGLLDRATYLKAATGLFETPGMGGTPGTGGATTYTGPCDIYAAASTPCVAAYSRVRRLSRTYSGPLYQVRKDSSATNTGTGGSTTDIGFLADGFADATSQDAFCGNTMCTVSLLYDQSGNNNHLKTGTKGRYGCTPTVTPPCEDDYESSATKGPVTAGGRTVRLRRNVVLGGRPLEPAVLQRQPVRDLGQPQPWHALRCPGQHRQNTGGLSVELAGRRVGRPSLPERLRLLLTGALEATADLGARARASTHGASDCNLPARARAA
jgi:hypothetical protein